MSNVLAIAAATATLRNLLHTQIPLLDTELSDLEVTTLPLDIARKKVTASQLNLFLYQTPINAAWRNMDMPRQVRPGESAAPPLPLNLHYLLTAYGRGEADDNIDLRVFGGAMSVMHDNPVLDRSAIAMALATNDLGEQFESLRVTPLPISIEDISKLWMAFQSGYRISAAYEVTVVLIDSLAPVRSALPVLQRGPGDRGVTSVAGQAPNLTGIVIPHAQPAARLGDDITITGKQLTTEDSIIRFATSRRATPIELAPQAGTNGGRLTVHIPSQAEDITVLKDWAPGLYTVALVQRPTGIPELVSNEIAFSLAPRITLGNNNAAAGTVNLALDCTPRIAGGQRILLLFGDKQIPPKTVTTPADTTQPTALTFEIPNVDAGTYVVRLRVDGVDSIPVVLSGTPPLPSFDPAQKVVVT